MTGRGRMVGRLALVSSTLALGVGALVGRLHLEGERALARSNVEFDRGHLRESLLHARRAASLYAPGLPHVQRADARLDAIAAGAESFQMREVALLAWQAIRTAELQRRWALGRPSDRAKQAERRLAILLADDGRHGSLVEQQQFSRQVEADFRADSGRSGARALSRLVALGATVAGLVLAILGLGPTRHRRRWLAGSGGLVAVGAVAWAILLLLA